MNMQDIMWKVRHKLQDFTKKMKRVVAHQILSVRFKWLHEKKSNLMTI